MAIRKMLMLGLVGLTAGCSSQPPAERSKVVPVTAADAKPVQTDASATTSERRIATH